jgi:2-polyprenyl-3-methyl-5-hydroxy-6-metoxy-1,4-benzoquinol methylase
VTAGTCPLCGGELIPRFIAEDRNRRISSQRFVYHRCGSCATLVLRPVPGDLGRYYPNEYYTLPPDRRSLLAKVGAERYKTELVSEFVSCGRLVEIGPAIGGFAVLAQEAGYETSVIEMDAACCRFLRDVVGVEVHETSEPVDPLRTHGPYDVIAMWHVMEHLTNPAEVVSAAAAALAPGGAIVIAAPNPQAWQFRVLGRRWAHRVAPRHLFLIPLAELASIARSLGLKVVVATTLDPGTLFWNSFGWRESLAGFARGRYLRFALRQVGSVVAGAMRPLDRREGYGSTYTVVLRRPS